MPRGTAVELVDQWEALAEKYPEAAERWHSVGPDVDASRLQAGDFLGYRDGVMLWNHLQMRRQTERLVEIAADSVANGTHPAGCGTLAAMATHEFGHAVEDVVRERLGEGEWRGLTDRLVDCCISGYTAQKTEECFAVAFAALHHGTMLTAGAKRAVSIVSEVLKSVGM